jgi:Ran GTPase-activating protein (RanGAP) involved in mRNA processing and transport
VKSFAGIFEGKGLPRLDYLGLSNSEWERELIVALAKAPIVRRLRTLDLTKGTLWREGAQALIEHAAAFRHLELLDVRDNYFDDEQAAAIKKAIPCANVADQKELDDDDDDEPYRYVTVGE